MTDVLIYPDPAALSDAAADRVAARIKEVAGQSDRFALALSGGSTPRELYRRLAAPPRRDDIPWGKVHIFWGDERAVPPDHPDSNYRMAHEALLSKVPVPPANVHRMTAEAVDLDSAAAEYEQSLRDHAAADGDWPRLDLILLGLGGDGHTASLFPGHPTLNEEEKWVVASPIAPTQPPVRRLTLTLPAINHAAEILVLVSGGSKAALVREILGGAAGDKYPAAHVHLVSGSITWMLDAGAASELRDLPAVQWPKADKSPAPPHSAPKQSAAV